MQLSVSRSERIEEVHELKWNQWLWVSLSSSSPFPSPPLSPSILLVFFLVFSVLVYFTPREVRGRSFTSLYLIIQEERENCSLILCKYNTLKEDYKCSGLCHSSGDSKSRIKVLAGLVSPEASLLGWHMSTVSPCPHMPFSFCTCVPDVCSSPFKDTSHIELVPYPYNLM